MLVEILRLERLLDVSLRHGTDQEASVCSS